MGLAISLTQFDPESEVGWLRTRAGTSTASLASGPWPRFTQPETGWRRPSCCVAWSESWPPCSDANPILRPFDRFATSAIWPIHVVTSRNFGHRRASK